MRYSPILIFTVMLSSAASCNKSAGSKDPMMLESSFEGSDPFGAWTNDQHCCDYSLTQSNNRFTDGAASLRLEVRSTDPQTSSSIRSELVQGSEGTGVERWYGFNIFQENWVDDNAGESIFQWHPDNTTGTGTASLWTSGGRYVFQENSSGGSAGSEYTDIGPIISDQWVAWVIHVKWAADRKGLIQVWKNGELMIDKTNIITAPHIGTYFKLGINKFGWGIQPSTVNERVAYYDEVRIGNEKANYEVVKPRH
jgi:Polysaccharide lyase